MEHPVTRAEFEALKESLKRNEEFNKAEFQSFRKSLNDVADNLNRKIDVLIQKAKNRNPTSQTLQRFNDEESSVSVDIGVDGPTRA